MVGGMQGACKVESAIKKTPGDTLVSQAPCPPLAHTGHHLLCSGTIRGPKRLAPMPVRTLGILDVGSCVEGLQRALWSPATQDARGGAGSEARDSGVDTTMRKEL